MAGGAAGRRLRPPSGLPGVAEPGRRASAGRPLDEARFIEGSELRVGQVLDELCDSAVPGGPIDERALAELWVEHTQEIGSLLAEAAGGPERAAGAGGGGGDAPAAGSEPGGRCTGRWRSRWAGRLADPDWRVRRAALHAAARLDDPRLGVAHIAALLADLPPGHTVEDRQEAEAAAAAALEAMRAQERLDPGALARALGPLLDRRDWQARLAAVRTLALGPGPSRQRCSRRAAADPILSSPPPPAAATLAPDRGRSIDSALREGMIHVNVRRIRLPPVRRPHRAGCNPLPVLWRRSGLERGPGGGRWAQRLLGERGRRSRPAATPRTCSPGRRTPCTTPWKWRPEWRAAR